MSWAHTTPYPFKILTEVARQVILGLYYKEALFHAGRVSEPKNFIFLWKPANSERVRDELNNSWRNIKTDVVEQFWTFFKHPILIEKVGVLANFWSGSSSPFTVINVIQSDCKLGGTMSSLIKKVSKWFAKFSRPADEKNIKGWMAAKTALMEWEWSHLLVSLRSSF